MNNSCNGSLKLSAVWDETPIEYHDSLYAVVKTDYSISVKSKRNYMDVNDKRVET